MSDIMLTYFIIINWLKIVIFWDTTLFDLMSDIMLAYFIIINRLKS